jgi:integrase
MVEDGVYAEEGVRLPDLAGWRAQKLLPEPRHVYVPIPTSLVDGIWAAAPALRQADPQAYIALLMSICCGLRRGEAANLRWSQILEIDGRRLIRLGVSKSGHPRLIPLEPAVWEELRSLAPVVPMTQPADPGAPVPAGEDYVLEGPTTKRWREPFDRLSAWLAGLGWDRRKKAHELRKHFGSLLATQHGTRTAAMVLGNTEPVLRAHYDALLSLPETHSFRG